MAEITMTQALNLAIDEAMADDPGVFCLGEDVAAKQGGGVFKITSGLTEKYGPNRIRATPISETAIIGAAVGAALAGQRRGGHTMRENTHRQSNRGRVHRRILCDRRISNSNGGCRLAVANLVHSARQA